MLVVCMCYNFLSLLQRVEVAKKYNTTSEGCPVDWQDLMMVLGGAVMKEEDIWGLLSV